MHPFPTFDYPTMLLTISRKGVIKMRRDEKSLLKQLAHLEEKLASLPEPSNATQKRLRTLWQRKLNRTKRMLLALRDGKEGREWIEYTLGD